MAVCMATTAPWMGGSSPSSSVPSSPTRTTAPAAWLRSDGPAVKYISAAPGTRTLTLPCPLAEIAPLATTRWAISTSSSTKPLSMTPPQATLAAEHAPDQSREPGGKDGFGRRVQLGQRPPSPCDDAIRGVHRGDVAQLAAGLVSARQEMTLVLPDGPVTVLQHADSLVNLTQQGNVVPAGLLGELAARGGRIGLARVQAPARGGPVRPGRRAVVVAQQQNTLSRVEHNDPRSEEHTSELQS